MNFAAHLTIKHVGVGILLVAAIGIAAHQLSGFLAMGEEQAKVWFYDQSEKRLYIMPRDTVPPDDGIGGERGDGVRAVVVTDQSDKANPAKRRVAYLEMYSPPLKKILQDIRDAHTAKRKFDGRLPGRDDPFIKQNTLVRRESDPTWYDMTNPEAETIVTEWQKWEASNGQSMIVCMP